MRPLHAAAVLITASLTLPLLAAQASEPPRSTATRSAAPTRDTVDGPLYVFALSRWDLAAAVDAARQRGFAPCGSPRYLDHVAAAAGPAWVVFVRPA
ncbi:MAG: hypothetical protein U1F60_15045 [Planctomycetota bacterium]